MAATTHVPLSPLDWPWLARGDTKGAMARIGEPLPLTRCPHCSIADPNIYLVSRSAAMLPRGDQGAPSRWALYGCATCGAGLIAQGEPNSNAENPQIVQIIPEERVAHADLPERARVYLDQAYRTLTAPDAAAVMAGSAVDAMLKKLGYENGSVYARIDQAVADHKLTQAMGDWAHAVRLGANRPRHADRDAPHVSLAEARRSVDFAEALGAFLFVLTARIQRGIEEAGGPA